MAHHCSESNPACLGRKLLAGREPAGWGEDVAQGPIRVKAIDKMLGGLRPGSQAHCMLLGTLLNL